MVYPDFTPELLSDGNFKLSWDDTNSVYTSIGIGTWSTTNPGILTYFEIRQDNVIPVVSMDAAEAFVSYTSDSITFDLTYPATIIAVAWAWGDLSKDHVKLRYIVQDEAELVAKIQASLTRKAARNNS